MQIDRCWYQFDIGMYGCKAFLRMQKSLFVYKNAPQNEEGGI